MILFLLGLLVRLSLIFVDYSWDVNNHMVWARDLLTRGAQGFYETQSSNVFAYLTPNYPPLAIFTFVATYPLQNIIHSLYWWLNVHISILPSNLIFFMEKTMFMAGLFKLPGILADLGLAFICFLFAKKLVQKDKKLQLLFPVLILFNPAFIFNSALWGQIDSIPIFFVVLATYLLLYTKKSFLSALSFLVALLFKPTALIFLPVYAVVFVKKYGIGKALINFFLMNAFFILSFLPFSQNKNILIYPYQFYYQGILLAQSLPFVTNGAFNFWVFITNFKGIRDTAPFIFNIPYRYFGYAIAGFVNLAVIYRLLKDKFDQERVFLALFITSMADWLFLTKMHERYTLLPLVFLLLFSLKNKKSFPWFIILSISSLINHYHSWSVPRVEFLVKIFESPATIYLISFINVAVFVYFLIQFYFGKVFDKKIR